MPLDRLCRVLRAKCGAEGLPVDPFLIADGLQVRVVIRKWPRHERPHAMCLLEPRLIILNGNRPETSMRFDLAHELGHFLFKPERWHDSFENHFAKCLLMPKTEFQLSVMLDGLNDITLAKFNVSRFAAELRAKELGWRG